MRVVFMGTPDIAATCLEKIIAEGFEVVAAYTQPDRPKGRGMKMVFPPVKELALAHNIPVYQPENFRESETVEQLKALQPDVLAVVAYGRILPQSVLDIPVKGAVNIHASLLPEYRGSAPYQWAVLDGKQYTGVTAQYMALQMDAGDIIDVAKTPIGPNETAGELLDRLAVLGPVDWNKTAQQVHNQVRGLNPWPVATMELSGKRFKVYETAVVEGLVDAPAGSVLGLTKTGLKIACGDGAVEIRVLQAEGGKRMAAPDYFRGHPLEM